MADANIANAYVTLIPTMVGAQSAVSKALAPAVAGAGADAGKELGKSMSSGMGTTLKALAGAAIVAGVVKGAKDSVAALARIETINSQTEAAIKSTGGAAKVSAKEVEALAGALEKKTATEAESIQEGANLLLTFKNIRNEAGAGNDVFNQSTTLMTDMARAMGTDAKGGAVQLGKALNDPTKGIAALNRVGVQFTDDQKNQIKTLQESGDMMGAQKIILAELQNQFGGSGAAYAKTYTGQMDQFENAIGDLGESIMSKAMPALTSIAMAGTTAFLWLTENKPVLIAIVALIGIGLTTAFFSWAGGIIASTAAMWGNVASMVAQGVLAAKSLITTGLLYAMYAAGAIKTGIATAAQWAWNAALSANPIGIVVLAIAALVAALVWFFTQTEVGQAIIENVWGAIKTAISAVADWWTGTAWPAIQAVITWFGQAFQTAGTIISGVWSAIQNAISTAWNWVRDNVFANIMWWIDVVKIAFGLYRDAIVSAWGAIKDGIATGWNWIRDNVFAPLKAGVGLIGDAFESVKDRIGTAWDKLKEIAAKPVNFILGTVYNDGIREWWNKISGAVGLDSLALPKASLVRFAQGSEDHRAQIARGGSMRLWAEPETGGEAYIPLAASKRGRSTAILANVAQRFGYNLSPYADGGIWNSLGGLVGDAWDSAKNLGRSIWDTGAMAVEVIKDPVGAIKKALESGVINPLMSRIGVGGDFVKMLGTLPVKFAGGLADKVKSMLGEQQQSAMADGAPSGSGVGTGAMSAMLQALIPGARVNSGFRAGARTAGFGNASFHSMGRAIDIGAGGGKSLSQIWDIINAAYGSKSQELLYTPKGANQILRGGKRGGTSGVTAKNHFSHVHWAMENGGMLFDNGGWMDPNVIGINQSRSPEPVFTSGQWDILEGNLRNGSSGPVHLADESVQRLASAILQGAATVSANSLDEQARERSGYRGRGF